MIKKYCDMCDHEVDELAEYVLPGKENLEVKDKQGNLLRVFKTVTPHKVELCKKCAVKVYNSIALFKSMM